MNFKRLKLMRAAARIQRLHVMPTHYRQSVGEHTFGVLAIIVEIYPDAKASLLHAALTHDVVEAVTGDTPAPVKWRFGAVEDALKFAETRISREFSIDQASKRSDFEKKVLKFADIMELLMFSIEEYESGDKKMASVVYNCINAMMSRKLCDVTPEALVLFDSVRLYAELNVPNNAGKEVFNGWTEFNS